MPSGPPDNPPRLPDPRFQVGPALPKTTELTYRSFSTLYIPKKSTGRPDFAAQLRLVIPEREHAERRAA